VLIGAAALVALSSAGEVSAFSDFHFPAPTSVRSCELPGGPGSDGNGGACVIFPNAAATDEYVEDLAKQGWRASGNVANNLVFAREDENACTHHVFMTRGAALEAAKNEIVEWLSFSRDCIPAPVLP
jgi:hypothetical protein